MISGFPWWLKVAVKMVLSFLPVSYEKVRFLVTGYRGAMSDDSYAIEIFHKHLGKVQLNETAKGTFLELGPGGSLVSGVLALAKGFDRAYLIDVGDFASKEIEFYRNIYRSYLPERLEEFEKNFSCDKDIREALRKCGIYYEVNGLDSLKALESETIDFSFSNAVFEHVRNGELEDTIKELSRIHRLNTFSSHRIDYKDHLGGGLNNLRFSNKLWESPLFPNSGFYTNRRRHSDFVRMFAGSGFEVIQESVDRWDELPIHQSSLDEEFTLYEQVDLLVSGADVLLKSATRV